MGTPIEHNTTLYRPVELECALDAMSAALAPSYLFHGRGDGLGDEAVVEANGIGVVAGAQALVRSVEAFEIFRIGAHG